MAEQRRRSSAPSHAPSATSSRRGDVDDDFRYGFIWAPGWLQCFNTAAWLLFFMSLANIFQSMLVNGLVGTVITSLERRYDLNSGQSSWIVSAYDVSTIPMLILVSYFGSRSHRARWTAAGLLVLVLGTAIFVLPHFLTGSYRDKVNLGSGEDEGLCHFQDGNGTAAYRECPEEEGGSSLTPFLAMFIVARLLHGLGAVPLYTICVTFMDDCVTKEQFSLYIAIFYASGILGPAIGYLVGGYMLTIYTDIMDENPPISETDPQWVGAWWPGFIIGAIILFLIALPMAGYAKDMPGAAEIRASKESEAYEMEQEMGEAIVDEGPQYDDTPTEEETVGLGELWAYMKALLSNPTYVFLTLFVCCDSLLTGGFTAFGPKYVENQFGESAAVAGMIFGAIVVPGGAGGTVAGGLLVKKLEMTCGAIMKWETIFTVSMLITSLMFFVNCRSVPFAGVTVPYGENSTWNGESFLPNLTSLCHENCDCANMRFQPVCGVDGVQYYSPCHAGCLVNDTSTFMNCSCVANTTAQTVSAQDECGSPDCVLTPLFMVFFFVAMCLLFACSSMNISATVRCVPIQQRSLAIGIQWILLRLLGTIPGPVIFGAAFDTACRWWEKYCGKTGTCLSYDNNEMGLNMFIICLIVKLASLGFIAAAWKLYRPPRKPDQEMYVVASYNAGSDRQSNGSVSVSQEGGVVSPVFEPDTPNMKRAPPADGKRRDSYA